MKRALDILALLIVLAVPVALIVAAVACAVGLLWAMGWWGAVAAGGCAVVVWAVVRVFGASDGEGKR